MTPLDAILAEVLALRDTEAVRTLMGDCRAVLVADGEAVALVHARMLLAGTRDYLAHELMLRGLPGTSEAGKVLGEKEPPADGCYWTGGVRRATGWKPFMRWTAAAPDGATHWCDEAGAGLPVRQAGWWRIPTTETGGT